MTSETATGFTAEDAVRTIDNLKGYEETLAARTAGITILIWAFVVAGIPLSYQGLAPWLAQQGGWGGMALGMLWAPWVAAGIATTAILWQTHSISLQKKEGKSWDWLVGIGFTLLFGLIALAVLLIVGRDTDTFSVMGVTTGVLTLVIATVNHIQYKHGRFWVPFYLAGVLILATGIALVVTGTGGPVAAFTTAFMQGVTYFLAGITMVARG